jgi:valyl-tRNA synthetase
MAYVERWRETIKRLARLADISFAPSAPLGSAQILSRGVLAALPLAGIVDFKVERARLIKERDRERKEIDQIDGKLSNPNFLQKAQQEAIDEIRERRELALDRLSKIEAALQRVEAALRDV